MVTAAQPQTARARAQFLVGVASFSGSQAGKLLHPISAGRAEEFGEILADAFCSVLKLPKGHCGVQFKMRPAVEVGNHAFFHKSQ
jgi:hypothetical protein